eukprot:scaffold18086_cov112-Isochrysis_galbana.AAC.2
MPSRCDSQRAKRADPDSPWADLSTMAVRTSARSSMRSSPRLDGRRLVSAPSAARAVCCCGPALALSDACSLPMRVLKVRSRSDATRSEVVRHWAAAFPASASLPQHVWQSRETSCLRTLGDSEASWTETEWMIRIKPRATEACTSPLEEHVLAKSATSMEPASPKTSGKT